MPEDIMPPRRRPNLNPARQQMRSLRLRGHSLGVARDRLMGVKPPPAVPVEAAAPPPEAATPLLEAPAPRPRFYWWQHLSRPRKLAVFGSTLIVLSAVISAFLIFFPPKEPAYQAPVLKVAAEPKPTTVASPLSGVQVDPKLAARPVTAVMIENSLAARPQSGLNEAGVVFEAISEGGITRFMALFQENDPDYVGPVRSLRPYYLDFSVPFDASVAHVGGSPEALKQIRRPGQKDLDQFFNPGAYWRASSRYSPHNVYTSFAKLDAVNKAKGYKTSKFTPWPRKEEAKLAKPTAQTIELAISSANYNVRYGYDPKSNSYPRRMGGKGHVITSKEKDSKPRQVKPKVVIALVMSHGYSGKYSVYDNTGSGRAYIFQDGGVTVGFWKKTGRSAQFSFITDDGKPIPLNPGQAWVTVVGGRNKISYKP